MLRPMLSIIAALAVSIYACRAWAVDSCEEQAKQLKTLFAESKACNTDFDCTTITHCPFGCYQPVAKAAVGRIDAAVKTYYDACGVECNYECPVPPSGVACQEHKCVVAQKATQLDQK